MKIDLAQLHHLKCAATNIELAPKWLRDAVTQRETQEDTVVYHATSKATIDCFSVGQDLVAAHIVIANTDTEKDECPDDHYVMVFDADVHHGYGLAATIAAYKLME